MQVNLQLSFQTCLNCFQLVSCGHENKSSCYLYRGIPFFFYSQVSAADVSAKAIAFACNGCHGTGSGSDKEERMTLKSRPAQLMTKTLLAFKYEKKPSSIMGRITKGYTDQELKAVALYYSLQ